MSRPWWPITVGVCIGALTVLVADRLTTPQVCEARSAVVVDPDKLPRGVLRWDGEIDFEKLRDTLLGDAILHQVIVGALPPQRSPQDEQGLAHRIRQRLYLTYTRRTQTIEIQFHDRDPQRAAAVVDLFARFFGREHIVRSATPVPVVPQRADFLLGVAGGLLGGVLVFVVSLLSRVVGKRTVWGHGQVS